MTGDAIRYATAGTAIGDVLLAGRTGATGLRICYASLAGTAGLARLQDFAERAFGGAEVVADEPALECAVRELVEYGAGRRREFDLDLELVGSDFELCVWAELQRIPYGETRTYGQVAEGLGDSGASRAVGRANGRNPVPVVVPCHRVVARNGIGGFTGGLEHKHRLLELERVHARRGQRLLLG